MKDIDIKQLMKILSGLKKEELESGLRQAKEFLDNKNNNNFSKGKK